LAAYTHFGAAVGCRLADFHVDLDSDAQASSCLVGGPVEVDDVLGREKVDSGDVLASRGEGVLDLLDEVIGACASLGGAADCPHAVETGPDVQCGVAFVDLTGRGMCSNRRRIVGPPGTAGVGWLTGAGRTGAACDNVGRERKIQPAPVCRRR
jgi:hypothetical protein